MALVDHATPVMVQALNAANQVVPGYTGTVTFTSSDSLATAASSHDGTFTSLLTFGYTFQASDKGSHEFWVTFGTAGKQSLAVVDSGLV